MAVVNKVWTKEEIKALLEGNDAFLQRAVVKIYEYQTAVEQTSNATVEVNGVGFNGVDAEILSSFAQQVQRGRILSVKQLAIARKKMVKYAGQLVKIANCSCEYSEGVA